jgi:PTH1 family peptidyl-tRNA hydrolase
MKLIVGLGNPGSEYRNTRHNIGFITVEYLAEKLGIEFNKNKFFANVGEGFYQGEKVMLMRPETFMNRSGQAVRAAVDFYKLDIEDILIIFDDMDLPCGELRIRAKGSAGGHNGMKNIIAQLSNNTQISRFKIGISHPVYGDTVNYVLGTFSEDEKALLRPAVDNAAEAALCWLKNDITVTMNRFNGKAVNNKK